MSTAAAPYGTAKRLLPSDDVRAYARWVRRQKGYGRWEPFVDAQPARDHLFHLMASNNVGWRRLADAAGVPQSTVTYLLYGSNGRRATRITPENARRLLALQADSTRGLTGPAVGTHRRIHVLMGEGWPQVHLGPHFGTHTHYVHAILKSPRVNTATAQSVTDAYNRLQGVDPLTCGVTAHGMGIAKRIATSNQWPDRLFWEDMGRIDDPTFDPAEVERELKRDELAALRREEITHLASYGCTPEVIHQRLTAGGHEIALSTIQAVVAEHRTGKKRDRKKTAVAA